MSDINITLPDGSSRTVSAGAPVRDVAAAISPGLAKAAYAAVVNGSLVDLSYPLERQQERQSPHGPPLARHGNDPAAAVVRVRRPPDENREKEGGAHTPPQGGPPRAAGPAQHGAGGPPPRAAREAQRGRRPPPP